MKSCSYLVFLICALYVRLVYAYYSNSEPVEESLIGSGSALPSYKYDRIPELEKECKSVLSSASELKPDANRIYTLEDELSFVNGDWSEDINGKYPILPFDDRRGETMYGNSSPDDRTTLKLASFWVTDVDQTHKSKKYVSLSGSLMMGITRDGIFLDKYSAEYPLFHTFPGDTELSIQFQGIYTESKKNGEKVLCLLGKTLLPSRDPESSDPWEWAKRSDSNHFQSPLMEDDRILLVLHYPTTFNLTRREIQGLMTSLNPKLNLKYFDEVHISSQFGNTVNYEFSSEKVVSKACEPYPYHDTSINGKISAYQGSYFCRILEEITREQAFTVLPNWRCNVTDEFCSKLGPFFSDPKIKETDGGFKDVKLHMQDVRCKQKYSRGNSASARVSALFRAVSPLENVYTAAKRSGLSNMTVSAEGIWKSASGQLCMLGCLGLVDPEGRSCNSRICLYIPISFSVKQRSIIAGTISSINDPPLYFPLSFEKLVQPSELWNYFRISNPYYTYTQIDLAAAVLEENEPFDLGAVIKKSLLQYPKLEDADAFEISLSYLAEDLALHISAYPDPVLDSPSRTDLQLEILSVGPLFGRYSSNISATEESPYHSKPKYNEKQLLLNVSAQLSLTGKTYSNFSMLFLEGLYDPHVGKIYLVGCRDVRASWNILFESMDLESGLDCLIEMVVSYPPTTARWLGNPTAMISLSSRRTEDDPLHFRPVKLRTLPIMYRRQREDIISRRSVEGVLQILTLSFAIACIASQLFYINNNFDSVPYMSLIMLGVQAIGYSIPLVTEAEALIKKVSPDSSGISSYDLDNDNLRFCLIDYTVKVLVMTSLLLTLRLCQKVWKSRIRLLTRSPLEPHRIPSDKWVFISTLSIHFIGFITVLMVHGLRVNQRQIHVKSYIIPNQDTLNVFMGWERELEEYVGVVQDFFLLPQVIGNLLWQVDSKKPLRKLYFMGITLVRLLPHVYDYLRAPPLNHYFSEEYEFVNPSLDFYSKFGDLSIQLIALVLVIVVYIQQRWGYERMSRTLSIGSYTLLPRASRRYERLPSKLVETELVLGANGVDDEDDEETR